MFMQTPSQFLFSSLYSTLSPANTAARQAEVERIANPAKRMVGLALHKLAVRQPHLAAAAIGLRYATPDLEYIASGGESSVFRYDSEQVVKVNRTSLLMSPDRRRSFEVRKRAEHERMAKSLGSFAVPQSSYLGSDQLFPDSEVMLIRQPFEELADLGVTQHEDSESMAEAIAQAQAQCPDIADQLGEFSERSRRLMPHGLVPDILGPCNLVMIGGVELKMIDGQPLAPYDHPSSPVLLARAQERFDMLDTALAMVA